MEKKIINLKGIILVGGHSSGTRFRPLSMELPKPLFPIGGKPMIYHHVNALSKVPGMKEVLIIGFYEAGVFDRFLTETQIEFPNLSIKYLREYKCLGTAGGIHHFKDEIQKGGLTDFFVMNADIASSFPLLGLYSAHSKKTGAICTMLSTTVDPEEATKYGCIVCDPQDEQKVVHFVEKPESFISNVISCGVYLFSSKIFPYLADALSNKRDKEKELGTPMSTMMHSNDDDDLIQFEKDVLPLLMPIKHLFTWTCDPGRDFWMQVKTGSSTISANRAYLQHYIQVSPGKLSLPKGENKKDEPKPTIIKPVFIHPSAIIHPTAKIGPNVSIGPRCMIGRGVRVRDSIILDNCEIKHDSCILNSVLGWDSKIGSWVRIEGAPFTDPLALTLKGYKLPSATIFGKDVKVLDEVIIRNCIVLPHKELNMSFENEILM